MAYKNSGFKMKNPMLMKSAKTSSPMQMNYKSPAKKMDPMYNGEPGVQKEDFAQFSKDAPTKVIGPIVNFGARVYKGVKKLIKGKPVSVSFEKPHRKSKYPSKKTIEYKKSTDRIFYNKDGTVNRKTTTKNK